MASSISSAKSLAEFSAAAASEEEDEDFKMTDLIEQIGEKRASTRVSALKAVTARLNGAFMYEYLLTRRETLSMHLMGSIRKGAGAEVVLAARLLSIVVVTLGEDGVALHDEFAPVLRTLARNPAKPPAARAAALQAVSTMCFASAHHDAEVADLIQLNRDVYTGKIKGSKKGGDELICQAIRSWAMLVSTMPDARIGGKFVDKNMGRLMELLDHDNVDVRIAAGEAIALLYEAFMNAEDVEDEEEDEEEEEEEEDDFDEDDKSDDEYSYENNNDDGFDIQELTEKLEELSTDGSKKRGKKDRKVQRASFRDILASVEDGTAPTETMIVCDEKVEFSGWRQILRLYSFRAVLGDGLLVHLGNNPVLADAFGLDLSAFAASKQRTNADRREMKNEILRQAEIKQRARQDNDTKKRRAKRAHIHNDDEY
eukprot:TRINITY_DN66460_c6_g1_i1.p1 TRINITY_DN66460_c6_g1~~TRINITY_DN66460_c6_g1_i1.p1  ORF type:complete len:466 (+),score=265.03 TRINITY_DN66460_c6_g1_i1:119-1399(+)